MRLSNQNRVIKRIEIERFKVTKDYEGEGEIPLTLLKMFTIDNKELKYERSRATRVFTSETTSM